MGNVKSLVLDELPYKLDSEFRKGRVVIHRRTQSRWWQVAEKEKWRWIRDLGTGGFGVVWLEQEGKTEELRAVKRMALLELASRDVDFRRELQTLAVLRDHRSLFVQFLGWYKDDNFIYLAMEYIKYGDLEQYLDKFGAQDNANAREITRQLLKGLVVLQKKHICHRDLKPQNILVASTSPIHVKLADFGVSKCYDGTNLDTRWGTGGYQAPELLGFFPQRGIQGYTNAVDMWALGCLLHKILTLETPFVERLSGTEGSDLTITDISGIQPSYSTPQTDMSFFYAYCSGTASLPTEALGGRVGIAGVDFIKTLLAPNPGDRLSALDALDHVWIRDELLSKGTNIDTILDLESEIALKAAAERGILELFRFLVGRSVGIYSSHRTPGGRTALQAVAEQGNREAVEFLLDQGADINAHPARSGGRTALQAAAEKGNLELVRFLLDKGANINAGPAKFDGRAALQAAAEGGYLEIVEFLLDKGADINAAPGGFGGRTALQAAAGGGHLEVVRFLLDKGANINNVPRRFGDRTALQAAAEGGHLEVVRFLLDKGADINAGPAESDGLTALQAAAEGGHLEVVRFLLNNGAKTRTRGGKDSLTFHVPQNHYEEIRGLLLGAGVDATAFVYISTGV